MSDFVVNLTVPYHSQDDGDSHATPNTCGPVSAAMVMDFYKEVHTGNEVYAQTGAGAGLITIDQILTAIRFFGFSCEYKSGLSFADVQAYLQQGIPPIALVKAQYLTSREDQGFGGGHFIVIDGYRDDGITANDPDFYGALREQGDHHFYTMTDFTSAWGNCHEDGNPDNSLIIIHPKQVVAPTPDLQAELDVKNKAYDELYAKDQENLHTISQQKDIIANQQALIEKANSDVVNLNTKLAGLELQIITLQQAIDTLTPVAAQVPTLSQQVEEQKILISQADTKAQLTRDEITKLSQSNAQLKNSSAWAISKTALIQILIKRMVGATQ